MMPQSPDIKCLSLDSPRRRRMKHAQPDSSKDEVYWTKRMKNNISAKKSRDNRRQQDNMLRTAVALLEKENAALREELWALKKEAGLDPKVVYSGDEQDGNSHTQPLYKSMFSRLDPAKARLLVDDNTERAESIQSKLHTSVDLHSNTCTSDRITTQMNGTPINGPFSRKAGSEYLKDALRCIPPPVDDVSRSPYQVGKLFEDQVRPAYCEFDTHNDEPTDLSMSSYHREESMEEDGRNETDTGNSNNSVQRESANDYISSCERFQERTDSKDIREELLALSEQLKQMQKIVCNKMSPT